MRGFGLHRMLMPAMAALAAVCVMQSASYFTDRIDEEGVMMETVRLSFADGGSVTADLSEADQHIEAFRAGESFTVSFSACYDGTVDALVEARLGLMTDQLRPGDVIRITDGSSEQRVTQQEQYFYSRPEKAAPGDMVTKRYTITIEACEGDDLNFRYDFSLAAAQWEINPSSEANASPEQIFRQIADHTNVQGFTLVTDPEKVCSAGGSRAMKKTWSIRLHAQVLDGNTASLYRWYAKLPDTEEKIIENENKSYLNLNLSEIHDGTILRYEVENEAGYVSSETIVLHISDTEVQAERRDN